MRANPHYLSAEFIDKIVRHAKEHLQDWQFRERLNVFKEKLLSRIDYATPDYDACLDAETDKFFRSEKISVKVKPSDENGTSTTKPS